MSRFAICLIAAIGVSIAGAVIQGGYSNRWGQSAVLEAASKNLETIPKEFGPWQWQASETWKPEVVDMLQCSGYIHRIYVHRKTGQEVRVAVFVGPPGPTSVHIPEVCYTSKNYDIEGKRTQFEVTDNGRQDAFWGVTFRSMDPGMGLLKVAYAWSDGGSWAAPDHPRFMFASNPILYKIQLAVPSPISTDIQSYDVCQEFLKDFLPILEQVQVKPSSE